MKLGRNDPCPCGSGLKYKKCCQSKESEKHPAVGPEGSAHNSQQVPASTASGKRNNAPPQAVVQKIVNLFSSGHYAEMEILAKELVTQFPAWAPGWRALGGAMKIQGKGGIAELRHAVELDPRDAEGHNNLGTSLHDAGHLAEAQVHLGKAVALKPDYAEAHYNLGRLLKDTGQLDAALASYRKAIKLKPTLVEAHHESGLVLQRQGHFSEALACHQRALELKPGHALALNSIGVILLNTGHPDLAEVSVRRALELKPDLAEAHNNLGNVLEAQFKSEDAIRSYRNALHFKPDDAAFYSNLLFCLSNDSEHGIDAQTLFAEHRRFGEHFERLYCAGWPQHGNSRTPERCLQIGFVSGDLRNHAVSSFIEPVLEHLAHSPALSLHAYANVLPEDNVTRRLRAHFKHWHTIEGLTDALLAEKIQQDGIDILIDLSGHTAHNRLLTFARKPAPVQASWMGYPGTTGLSAMDYYFADRFFLPPGKFDNQFTEKIARLPASAPFLPYRDAPPVNSLPALNNGYMTFGSFNRPNKISRPVVALWSQLLRALPESRMLLGGLPEQGKYEKLNEWFAQEGIARERFDFHPRSGMDRYLSLYQQVDICLDSFPYTGGTTTLHALWMGVPTITLVGGTVAGRPGASILGHVGLDAFVADDAADFVRKGLSWAGNPVGLSGIRSELRERFAKSALGHPELVAAGLERALRIMWQRWCAGQPAESFEVSRQDVAISEREAVK